MQKPLWALDSGWFMQLPSTGLLFIGASHTVHALFLRRGKQNGQYSISDAIANRSCEIITSHDEYGPEHAESNSAMLGVPQASPSL